MEIYFLITTVSVKLDSADMKDCTPVSRDQSPTVIASCLN